VGGDLVCSFEGSGLHALTIKDKSSSKNT